jgi:hypothetical protein
MPVSDDAFERTILGTRGLPFSGYEDTRLRFGLEDFILIPRVVFSDGYIRHTLVPGSRAFFAGMLSCISHLSISNITNYLSER